MRFVIGMNEIQATSAAIAAVISLAFIISRIPYFWRHVTLANKYASILGERDYLRGAQAAALSAAEGWKAAVDQLSAQVQDLREDVSRLEMATEKLRRLHVVSARYIASLIKHIRTPKLDHTMPPIPPELEDDVLRHLDDAG